MQSLSTPGLCIVIWKLQETTFIWKENSHVRLFLTPLPQPESPHSVSWVFLGEQFCIPKLRLFSKMPKEFGSSAPKEVLWNKAYTYPWSFWIFPLITFSVDLSSPSPGREGAAVFMTDWKQCDVRCAFYLRCFFKPAYPHSSNPFPAEANGNRCQGNYHYHPFTTSKWGTERARRLLKPCWKNVA